MNSAVKRDLWCPRPTHGRKTKGTRTPLRETAVRLLEGRVADEVQSCWLDRIPLTLAQRGLCAHEPTHPWGQVPSAILSPADKVLQPRTSSTSKTQILAGTNQT